MNIDGETVKRVLTYDRLIPAIEKCFKAYSDKSAVQPLRTRIDVTNQSGYASAL